MEMKELATLARGGDRLWKIVDGVTVGALYPISHLLTSPPTRSGL